MALSDSPILRLAVSLSRSGSPSDRFHTPVLSRNSFLNLLWTVAGSLLGCYVRRQRFSKSTPLFLVVVILWICVPAGAQNLTVNLMDFGAVGNKQADDGPALKAALTALANGGGGTLIVPAGKYAIVTPVAQDFTGLASSIKILGVESSTPVDNTGGGSDLTLGLDLTSEFYPRTGIAGVGLHIKGLQTFLIKDIAFVGTPNVETDARITLLIDQVEDASIRHCEFYGLSSVTGNGAIVTADRSRLNLEQSKFLGSAGASGAYVPIVQNLRWKSIKVTNSTFVDYGQRAEIYGKLLYAALSWINIGSVEPPTPDSPRREVIIRDVFLDEGAYIGIFSLPEFYGPTARIDLIYITQLRMNVANLGTYGNWIDVTKTALVEKSKYEWSQNAGAGIRFHSVGTAIVDQSQFLVRANRISASWATKRLSVVNSVYDFLTSDAVFTEAFTTATLADDPVHFVRSRYEATLNRGLDPAGHFYWSDVLLRCGTDQSCLDAKRGALETYLANTPPEFFTLTGRTVDQDGQPLVGVPIVLDGGVHPIRILTDAAGRYRFSNLPTAGSYTVTAGPTQHHTVDTPTQTVTTPVTDQVVDFTASVKKYSINGRIRDSKVVLPNVTITLSGAKSASTTTDINGSYVFNDLPALANYTITPSKNNYSFQPGSETFTELNGNKTATIFVGTVKVKPGVPILISHSDSTRALALESVLHLKEPFNPRELLGWSPDGDTRIVLFAMNFELQFNEGASAVTAEAVNSAGQVFPLTVEKVSKVTGLPWLNSVVVRLRNDMGNGDVLVRIAYRGNQSNRVRLGIGQIGGGPPDDAGSGPTPGQAP